MRTLAPSLVGRWAHAPTHITSAYQSPSNAHLPSRCLVTLRTLRTPQIPSASSASSVVSSSVGSFVSSVSFVSSAFPPEQPSFEPCDAGTHHQHHPCQDGHSGKHTSRVERTLRLGNHVPES